MGYYVYIHTCKANGKRYVGCTTQAKPELRWQRGRGYQYNDHFYKAILKYGWDNFEHEVFEVGSKEEMYRKEVELISFYHSNDPNFGYNHSSGGEKSALGCKYSEEIRKKKSEAGKRVQKKVHADPEYRRKISEAGKRVQKKVHADPEYRKRISETLKERWSDPEVRKRVSEVVKERCSDPEYRKKLSEVQKKVHSDPEYRKKLSEAGKGKIHTEETKRRMSETAKNRPKVKIKLPDGTIVETTKNIIVRWYINKGKKFEYVD